MDLRRAQNRHSCTASKKEGLGRWRKDFGLSLFLEASTLTMNSKLGDNQLCATRVGRANQLVFSVQQVLT
jgi:hypothetical protein